MSDTLEKLCQRVLDLEAQVDDIDSDLEALENTVHKEKPVEPLKELLELREQNKALKNFAAGQATTISRLQDKLDNSETVLPLACTKFKNATKKEWVAKLNEEVGEVIEAIYDTSADKSHIIREMVDVVTVIKSMAYSFEIKDDEWNCMQAWVNNRNVDRGYMDEPKEEPSND